MEIFDRLKNGLKKTSKQISAVLASFTGADDDFYDSLEETLILADVGVEASSLIVEHLREEVIANGYRGADEIRTALASILEGMLNLPCDAPSPSETPTVVLVIGVNGAGKTTTIGKLASQYTARGKSVLLCAADTFRAAASEQLALWAKRTGSSIIKREEGADPASVIYDAMCAAKARGSDIVICDTAGRLHNKANLMNELAKISRVVLREMPEGNFETLLVIDATTGQNGLVQARQFKEAADITGIVLTKLDGTAKGGIVLAIAKELGIPVRYVGVGEGVGDLIDFDAREFVYAMLI